MTEKKHPATSDPSNHGWVKCVVCSTWLRPESAQEELASKVLVGLSSPDQKVHICADASWCIARRSEMSDVERTRDAAANAALQRPEDAP